MSFFFANSFNPPANAIASTMVVSALSKEGTGFGYLSQNVELPAVDCLNDHRDLGISDVTDESALECFLELGGGSSRRLHFSHQRQRDSSIRSHGDLARQFRLLPDIDGENVIVADDVRVVGARVAGGLAQVPLLPQDQVRRRTGSGRLPVPKSPWRTPGMQEGTIEGPDYPDISRRFSASALDD